MNAPAVIQGSLVDARNVQAHKCMRLSIDVPAELASQVIAAFGWPTMAAPVAVAVARLDPAAADAVQPEPAEAAGAAASVAYLDATKERTRWADKPLAQQAGIRCEEARFYQFLAGQHTSAWNVALRDTRGDADSAAKQVVRDLCCVASRKDIRPGTVAGRVWRELDDAYWLWLRYGEQAA